MPSLTIEFIVVSLLISFVPDMSAQKMKEKKTPKAKGYTDPDLPGVLRPTSKQSKVSTYPKTATIKPTLPPTRSKSLDEIPSPTIPPSVARSSRSPSEWNKKQPTLQPSTSSSSGRPSIKQATTSSPSSQLKSITTQPTSRIINTAGPFQNTTSSIPSTKAPNSITMNPSSSAPVMSQPGTSTLLPTVAVGRNVPTKEPSLSSIEGNLTPSPVVTSATSTLTFKPTTNKAPVAIQNNVTTSTVVTTTVNVPEFSLFLFFGGSKNRRLLGNGDFITQPFSGESILTSLVQTFLTKNFQNITTQPTSSSSSTLTYLRIVSMDSGSTIYAVIQPNLTLGKQWITANYSGYSSFQGLSKIPASDDLGLSILNAFSPTYGKAYDNFLEALHSTENVYLQQVTEVHVALKNGRLSTIQIESNANNSSSILAGTVISSAVCLIFISAVVYLIRRNQKQKRKDKKIFFSDKVSLGCHSRSSPPMYISIPYSDKNNITTTDMTSTTTNIFDVAIVNTTCWNAMNESSNNNNTANLLYTFQSIKAPSGGSRGSSSLEQILEESSCNDSIPAITNSFEMANTSDNNNISFNSDVEDSGEYWDSFCMNALHENKTDTDGSIGCSMSLPGISPSSSPDQIFLNSPAMT